MLDKALLLDIPDGICLSTQDPLVFEKQVIYVGDFEKRDPATNELMYSFSVDEATIDHWIRTHNDLVAEGIEVPMPEGHTEAPSARQATALELSKKADSKGRTSLFVKLKFKNEKAAHDFAASQVSLYTPPVLYQNNKTFVRPIRHICFTDYPVITGLDPLTTIAASYSIKEPTMYKAFAVELGLKLEPTATEEQAKAAIQEHVKKTNSDLALALDKAKNSAPPTPPVDPLKINTDLQIQNRKLRVDALLLSHKITSAEAKEISDKWTCAGVALSAESDTAFDMLITTFEKRKEIVALGKEQSGRQVNDGEEKVSPLVAQARKMAADTKRV